MASERIKWHPAFAAAIQLEFIDYKEELEFLEDIIYLSINHQQIIYQ